MFIITINTKTKTVVTRTTTTTYEIRIKRPSHQKKKQYYYFTMSAEDAFNDMYNDAMEYGFCMTGFHCLPWIDKHHVSSTVLSAELHMHRCDSELPKEYDDVEKADALLKSCALLAKLHMKCVNHTHIFFIEYDIERGKWVGSRLFYHENPSPFLLFDFHKVDEYILNEHLFC